VGRHGQSRRPLQLKVHTQPAFEVDP
jgi:hypothetical protein